MNYGYIKSKLDGTEHIFSAVKQFDIPEAYSYQKFIPRVLNQGERPICVPCSISAFLNWNINASGSNENTVDNNINLIDIYSHKTTSGDGMTFKDALTYIRHNGVKCDKGITKIEKYAMIGSVLALKQALILNGPCVGAVLVYNSTDEFWKNNGNERPLGGHALSIVGYNKDGFIIRNSWGCSFGNNGYVIMKYEDFNCFLETWTII